MKKFSIKTIVAIGIGAALFFVVGRFLAVPVFANTTLTFQYVVLAFFAVVFGPIAGMLIGLIGHILIDLSWGSGLWWSWIAISAIVGLVIGLICNGIDLDSGEFKMGAKVKFIISALVGIGLGFGLVAPVSDIFIYSEPTKKAFTQAAIATTLNFLTTAILGTLLLLAYSKTRTKKGSLSADVLEVNETTSKSKKK